MSNLLYQETFTVVGIEARTNNAAEMGPQGIIVKQWDKFMKKNLLEKIPNKADHSVIAAYTEYDSDKNGDYTFFLGAKVTAVTRLLPEGMVTKIVPTGHFKIITSEKGHVWEVVQKVWKMIWTLPASDIGSETSRAYKFDYEIYDQRAQDPMNSIVDVYLGIKME